MENGHVYLIVDDWDHESNAEALYLRHIFRLAFLINLVKYEIILCAALGRGARTTVCQELCADPREGDRGFAFGPHRGPMSLIHAA